MNDATKQLFEFIKHPTCSCRTSQVAEDVKRFIDAGADINAVNEDNLNLLQVLLQVESPELPLSSTIKKSDGYGDFAFLVAACLQNGFQCSKADLTDLLSVYCCPFYELEPGDLKLICSLLEYGADWNCKSDDEPHLLTVLARNDITWRGYAEDCLGNNVADWRYELLCKYYNAGGDLYVKNDRDECIWESYELPLTTLAFLLEKKVNVSSGRMKMRIPDRIRYIQMENDYANKKLPETDLLGEHVNVYLEFDGCCWSVKLGTYDADTAYFCWVEAGELKYDNTAWLEYETPEEALDALEEQCNEMQKRDVVLVSYEQLMGEGYA